MSQLELLMSSSIIVKSFLVVVVVLVAVAAEPSFCSGSRRLWLLKHFDSARANVGVKSEMYGFAGCGRGVLKSINWSAIYKLFNQGYLFCSDVILSFVC